MKYLLLFSFLLAVAAAVFSFMQYQQINDLKDKLEILENKLPKYNEAFTELEMHIQKLEMDNAILKSSKTQSAVTLPNPYTQKQIPEQQPLQTQPTTTPTFKDMQKKKEN